MDLEKLGASKEHEGQALIHIIQIQEEPNLSPNGGTEETNGQQIFFLISGGLFNDSPSLERKLINLATKKEKIIIFI
jgi:hypothetical protein